MPDSLVLGTVELLGGGAPSTQPGMEGAIIRLGREFSLSAPQWQGTRVAGLLFAGEQITNLRASNRTPVIPVVILVPPTGDEEADRQTLAAAREYVLQSATAEQVRLTWTREGGLPLVLDIQGVTATTVEYSIIRERNLCALLEIECEAFPFGHSDTEEQILLTSSSSLWPVPPAPVTVDAFATAANFLRGDAATFEAGLAQWQPAVNATLTRSTAQAHSGTGSMLMTSAAGGTTRARHCTPADPDVFTYGIAAEVGDTVTGRWWTLAATTGRTTQAGLEFYDGTGTILGTVTLGSAAPNNTSTWTQATVSGVAPDGTVRAVLVTHVSSPAAGEGHYFDDMWLDNGQVYSYDDPNLWTQSTQAPIASGRSARWSRADRDAPTYDRNLPAALDISGRNKITFYAGLATSRAQAGQWNKGTVTFRIELFDATGAEVAFWAFRFCRASQTPSIPHWQLVTANIPQKPTGFDYTTISAYRISAYDHWDGKIHQGVLQAGFYLGLVQVIAYSSGTPTSRALFSTLPGIIGTAPTPVGIVAAPGPSSASTVVEWNTSGTKNFTAPSGITKLDWAEGWAAGGGAAGAGGAARPFVYPWFAGGGGGAGEYAKRYNIPLTPLAVYHPVVGAAGVGDDPINSSNTATNGGDTYFPGDSGVTMRAHGGNRGWRGHTTGGGKGGTGSVDDVHYPGGDGWQANAYFEDTGWSIKRGGAGGAAAGQDRAGKDATGTGYVSSAPAGASGGGPGGEGGHLYDNAHNGQTPSTGPGGGGGGGAVAATDNTATGTIYFWDGGNGRPGFLRISYGAGAITPLVSLLAHMPPPDEPLAFSPVIPVGNGADTPNGATAYPVPDVGGLKGRFDGTYTVFAVASSFANTGTLRTLTATFRQYPYSGGTAQSVAVARDFTPSTDIINGFVELGTITLPIAAIPDGQTDAYFEATLNSGQTGDRYYDLIMISTGGQFMLWNTAGAGYNSIWIDPPDRDHDLGLILGSDADRNRAWSITADVRRWSGGPMTLRPGEHNRLLLYSRQGVPGASCVYVPNWLVDRLQ
jgi:hypothetical protein